LFDVSMRLMNPSNYGAILAVAAPFFVLLCTLYAVAWQGGKLLRARK